MKKSNWSGSGWIALGLAVETIEAVIYNSKWPLIAGAAAAVLWIAACSCLDRMESCSTCVVCSTPITKRAHGWQHDLGFKATDGCLHPTPKEDS